MISEAAKKAAGLIRVGEDFQHPDALLEHDARIIQSAIDAETAALREELDALKKRFAHLINNQGHDVDEYYRDEPTEETRPTLHECDLAAKDAEIARLRKLNVQAVELVELREKREAELVEALKKLRYLIPHQHCHTCEQVKLIVADALKKVGAE